MSSFLFEAMNSIIVADCRIKWRQRPVARPRLWNLHVAANFIKQSSLVHVFDGFKLHFLNHLSTNPCVMPKLLSAVGALTSDIASSDADIQVPLAFRIHDATTLFSSLLHIESV